ncbi:replication-associated protein [Panicum ecklonii-associated virus]|uniref:replication-associated protein n=1 Tax=Panicum ecklonii-associated virus TaxID=2282645 RepID=UPI000DF6251A|nr:replication-associated protein [Panicum ecklonii-associated virus]AXF50876.1 replication-associated protein [Panicum ecklonii-associated virus]
MTKQGSLAKHWVFTSFADEVVFFSNVDVQYCIFGNEQCPKTGRWHKQGYVVFKVKKRMTALKKIDPTAHWEIKRGSVQQAIDYCKKDDDWYEYGEPPVEERSGANAYAEAIAFAEAGDLESVKQFHPGTFLRYKRTLEGLIKYDCVELDAPCGYWIYGKPGSGKDGSVMELKPFVKSHSKWWDGYKNEPYVVLQDLDHIDAKWIGSYLKQWSDRYSFNAEYKGGSMKIRPKRFYVTSNYKIGELFSDEICLALKRRFHVILFDEDVVLPRPVVNFVSKKSLIDF